MRFPSVYYFRSADDREASTVQMSDMRVSGHNDLTDDAPTVVLERRRRRASAKT